MKLSDYRWEDPELQDEGGRALRALDNPHRIARLVRALEAFLEADSDTAFRIAPELHGGPVEVFAVPPPADLARLPDALALVRVDHRARILSLVAVFRDVGTHPGTWSRIQEAARQALA